MVFRNQYDDHVRFFTEPGDHIRITYEPYYDENGNLELKEAGKIDQYLDIQSHADSVDLDVILAKYRNGDPDALNRVQGFYADVTGAPKSMADVLNIVIKGETEFNTLPLEVRAKFDYNYAQFLATMGSQDWISKLGFDEQKEFVEPEIEIKEGDKE